MNFRTSRPVIACALVSSLALAGCAQVHVVGKEELKLPPLQFPLRTLNYPSGLHVVVEHDDRTDLAGVFLVVGSGSTSDPAGKEGLAHYIEHLAFRSRPTGRQSFWDLLDKAGTAEFNGVTDFDSTRYFEIGLASHLGELLQLEGRRMANPVVQVPDAERAIELDVVKNEMRLKNETGYVGEVLDQAQRSLFPAGFPYQRSVIGSHESLSAITRADVDAFIHDHYRPENMTLLILGNVDLKDADKLIAESLPRRLLEADQRITVEKRMPDVAPALPEEPPAAKELVKIESSVSAPELWLAWSLPRSFDADEYLSLFVPGMVGARLGRLRQDDDDLQNVSATVVPGIQASMLLVQVQLRTGEHPAETLERVLAEVPKIWNDFTVFNTPAEVEFGRARRALVVEQVSAAQDLAARGFSRVTATHFSGDATLFSRTVKELTELRQKAVVDYASPYLTRERARAALFLPEAGGAAPGARKPLPLAQHAPAGKLIDAPPGWENERLRELLAEPKEHESYTLPSGMRVVLERRPGLPLLSASLSFDDTPANMEEAAAALIAQRMGGLHFRYDLNALAHGTEEMFNGSPEAIGAFIRSDDGPDHFGYSIEGSALNGDLLIALLAEYARSVKLERGEWVYFDEKVIPWMQRYESQPRNVARRAFLHALLDGSAYGSQPTTAELHQSSQSAAAAWLRRTHDPAHAQLAVVGDLELSEMKSLVADSFGNWKPVADPIPRPPALAADEAPGAQIDLQISARPGATQSELAFGCLFSPASDGRTAARHSVAAQVLSDRLWIELRTKLGATYGSSARAHTLLGGTSYLEVQSAIETAKLEPVLGALRRSLDRLAEKPPSDDAVAWAKIKRADGEAVANMRNLGLAGSALRSARLDLQGDTAALLEAVTPEMVRDDLKSCLATRPTLSIVGDEQAVRAAFDAGWKAEPAAAEPAPAASPDAATPAAAPAPSPAPAK